MKLRTEKGKWIITHNGRVIEYNKGLFAFYYCYVMKDFEKQIAPTHCVYPVKSLVPHPKKRRFAKKWKEKVKRIKSDYDNGVHYHNEDKCICCGDTIPEGRQVCPSCEVKK